jgi:hypothetical protein
MPPADLIVRVASSQMRGKRSRRRSGTGGEAEGLEDPQADADLETPEEDKEEETLICAEDAEVEPEQPVSEDQSAKAEVEDKATLSDDLDVLGKELEKSLGATAPAPVAATPEINATPEEILGVVMNTEESSASESKPQAPPAPQPAESPKSGVGHAAMATEVLRATTDQAGKSDDADSEESADSKVRFSDDVTISPKKKRKLFGR